LNVVNLHILNFLFHERSTLFAGLNHVVDGMSLTGRAASIDLQRKASAASSLTFWVAPTFLSVREQTRMSVPR
jgi:hypothetical protein